ncbi:arginine--tRNA ligase [Candidatus Parcubacteria bacterium]|nr:arginine--tRNA ligase [Candidatus Parcubacteria bacterium]
MKATLERLIREALGDPQADFVVEHPTDLKMGDYSTNAAIKYRDKKEQIFEYLNNHKPEGVEKVEMVGPGFINFYLSKDFYKGSLNKIIKEGDKFGKGESLKGEKVMVEYTDPNPFKEFHIGHLMSNAIGEAISRIIEWNGAEVKRANYQGDVGIHVAKAVWGMKNGERNPYVAGAKAYEDNEKSREEIEEINTKLYDRSDKELNALYDVGRKESLDKFEDIYRKLGTKFDYYFFESETAPIGKKIVEENTGKVFEESDGAVVFHAEKHNPHLHTRVFINSKGLPTYEAKELGLTKKKFETEDLDESIVITANEQSDYFCVVLEAVNQIYPELRNKMMHLSHGVLKLPSGKMSSRTGEVISAESFIEDIKGKVKDDEQVAIGAIKYMILRSNIGGDIVFDIDKSVSTEGDSGVYLQYAHARANSLLEKAGNRGQVTGEQGQIREVERLLYRFPEIVERAQAEYAPHHITTYLTELAGSFNNFYAHEQVIGDSPESGYRLAIVEAVKIVLKNGLTVLGIPAPEKM